MSQNIGLEFQRISEESMLSNDYKVALYRKVLRRIELREINFSGLENRNRASQSVRLCVYGIMTDVTRNNSAHYVLNGDCWLQRRWGIFTEFSPLSSFTCCGNCCVVFHPHFLYT
ncbi:hypothetical protein CEXT_727701 [Caerostris extrusa]|uniref:Uncharacterized protein n=1 Tax=Caerostris extrusa TaxID=172846 RepID=A0AAV4NRS1_CAEEX|nr:hypothetical protein CEXT_727701 [Caerostris extrusa]